MDSNTPYMPSVSNLHKILDKMQKAGVPEVFNLDFLKDLGFSSSNDRAVMRLLKFLGMLDAAGRPQASYRQFVDHTQAKSVLASRIRAAYDDLYLSDRDAHSRTSGSLKGWFKTKTGAADGVAEKMATTFKSLAQYADFSTSSPTPHTAEQPPIPKPPPAVEEPDDRPKILPVTTELGFVYRIEIHLPDTQNVETFRAIFKALREELMS